MGKPKERPAKTRPRSKMLLSHAIEKNRLEQRDGTRVGREDHRSRLLQIRVGRKERAVGGVVIIQTDC